MKDSSSRDVEVFSEVVELPAAERVAFLERACEGDAKLQQRVEILLQIHDNAGDFLEQSPQKGAIEFQKGAMMGEKPGDRIGRYQLLEQIGEGGCGVVYMAEQEEGVRRRVALKVIKPGMDTKSVIARFEAERQALALMDHPNIAKVFDAGATGSGRPYFVMELVRGFKITEYCDENSLTTEERLNLFVQVCHAVQHAHQKGIIHRDIKPSNILVTRTDEGAALPMVIDFGIAKATNQRLTDETVFTASEMLIGTPAYMSPEQAALTSVDVDTRTDIYSLGVLLYELLTAATPFDTGELFKVGLDEVRRAIRERDPVRPSTRLSKMAERDLTLVALRRKSEPPKLIRVICGDLDWIVMKAMEKDRTRRYETAHDLALDIKRFLTHEAIAARPPSATYKFHKLVLRNKVLFVAIGIVAVLLVASLILVTASLTKERQALGLARAGKAKADTEAAKSRQVTRFLEDMLQGVGPSVASGKDTKLLREILDKTAGRVGKELTNQPEVELELRTLTGRVYREIGNYDLAAKMHRAALSLNREQFGSASEQAASSLDDLGQALYLDRKLSEAEGAHLEALGIRRQIFGNLHSEVAASLNNLASVYRRQRRLPESEALIREGLEIRRKLFGNESLEVADSLHNLCVILGDEGNRAESEATARMLLAIRRRLLGNDHELVAAALSDVAWSTGLNGKQAESELLEGEALEVRRKVFGDDHLDVTRSISSIGERMRARGNLAESHAVLSAALSIQIKLFGEDHPAVLDTLRNFGWTLEAEGKWPEAESAYREALILWRKRAGNDGSQAVEVARGLVHALIHQKRHGDAEQVLGEVLTPSFVRKPASVELLATRADLMGSLGRWQEAAADAALAIEHQPAEHYRYHMLAAALAATHDRPGYEQLCRRIIATFTNTTNPYIAERMAKDCLILPHSGVELLSVDKMADTAVAAGRSGTDTPIFQTCKALSNYRLGRFKEAVEWAEKALNGSQVHAKAQACTILAMAHWNLGHADEARAELAEGDKLVSTSVSARDNEDVAKEWVAWILARIWLDEATSLIRPLSPAVETQMKR